MANPTHATIFPGNPNPFRLSLPSGWQAIDLAPSNVVTDVREAVSHALQHPLDFPPLQQATVPGDRIVLAIDPLVPEIEVIIGEVIKLLTSGGLTPDSITLVIAQPQATDRNWLSHVGEAAKPIVDVAYHDPSSDTDLGYLAASLDEALPIYINRRLLDADLVIPITCARHSETLDYVGPSGIFPLFTNAEAQRRFQLVSQIGSESLHLQRRKEADEAAWLMGIQLVVQVVPAGEGRIAAVIAGTPDSVDRQTQAICERDWHAGLANPVHAVVAEIDGDSLQQTWNNVARAIHSAKKLLRPGGAIIVCSQLVDPPGRALQRLAGLETVEKIEKLISNDRTSDALAASVILETKQANEIFLVSNLAPEVIEDLGIGVVSDDKELDRLVHQFPTGVILHAAQFQCMNVRANA